ncbi:hypothetical protein [Novosphingobium sp.]|uniref:hypothetical protein n=1 Tax=Novosphingobium sp. TaxID=1874826 RepID=UPI00260E18FB|nr:hypothetical protein [Novosphingobium sp.]
MPAQDPASRNRRPARTFIDKFAVGFAIAKTQTEIAKLKRFDLKDTHARIGEAVVAEGIDRPSFKHLLDRFKSTEQQIQRLDGAHKLPSDAQVSEKGAYVAARAKAKVQIEKIRLQQKAVLVEVGEIFSRESDIPESFANEVAHAKELTERIASKEAEVLELKATVSSFYRHPLRVAGALIALIVIYNVWVQASAAHGRWQAQRQAELAIKESDARIKEVEAEARRFELEERERRAKEELERKLAGERARAERKQQEEEQKAAIAREKEEDAQRLRDAELAQERARVAEQEAWTAKQASIAEEARKKEQAAQTERAQLAERLLSEIDLYPKIYLSGGLIAERARVDFVSKEIDALRQAQQSKDWLSMISLLEDGQPYTAYPVSQEIEKVARKLKSKAFSFILRTPRLYNSPKYLYCAYFEQMPGAMMEYRSVGQEHPDGIGYITNWSPTIGPMIFIVGDYYNHRETLDKFYRESAKQIMGLATKLRIGELTAEEYQVAEKDLRLRVFNTVKAWADRN